MTRPGIFGNPWTCKDAREAGYVGTEIELKELAVDVFRRWLVGIEPHMYGRREERDRLLVALPSLRGKNLACWCKPGEPCHADVLLEVANR